MPYFTLRVTLDDTNVYDFTDKHTFNEAKSAIEEMQQEGVFTLPLMSPVVFVPWFRVKQIELISAP